MDNKDYTEMSRFELSENARRNSEYADFKKLSLKYGIAMALFFVNSTVVPILFVLVLSLFGITITSPMTDETYALLLFSNSVLSYAFPVVFLLLLFSKDSAKAPLDFTYQKIKCEPLLMFSVSLALGSAATIITRIISLVVDIFFSTGMPEDVFSSSSPQTISQLAVFFICVGIIAPICEEIMFRQLLLAPLRKYGDLAASLVSALIFALYHGNLDQFPYAFAVGFIYGVIACRSNRIITTMILHAINNISLIFMSYLPPEEAFGNKTVYDILGYASLGISILFDLLMFAGAIIFIVLAAKGIFRLNSHSMYMTKGEKAKMFLLHPSVIVGVGLMIAAFFA